MELRNEKRMFLGMDGSNVLELRIGFDSDHMFRCEYLSYEPSLITEKAKIARIQSVLEDLSIYSKYSLSIFYNCSPLELKNKLQTLSIKHIVSVNNSGGELNLYLDIPGCNGVVELEFDRCLTPFSLPVCPRIDDIMKKISEFTDCKCITKENFNLLSSLIDSVKSFSEEKLNEQLLEFFNPNGEDIVDSIEGSGYYSCEDSLKSRLAKEFKCYKEDLLLSTPGKDSFELKEGWHSVSKEGKNLDWVYFKLEMDSDGDFSIEKATLDGDKID